MVLEGVAAPKQRRSREALERTMTAALELLQEPAAVDFKLADVSRRAQVSIGSIYARFNSKADLIRAVHNDEMERLEAAVEAIALDAPGAASFSAAVRVLVGGFVRLLAERAPLLRSFMWSSAGDPAIQIRGRQARRASEQAFASALCELGNKQGIPISEEAAHWCFDVVNSVMASSLGFGLTEDVVPSTPAAIQGLSTRLANTVVAYVYTTHGQPNP